MDEAFLLLDVVTNYRHSLPDTGSYRRTTRCFASHSQRGKFLASPTSGLVSCGHTTTFNTLAIKDRLDTAVDSGGCPVFGWRTT